MPFVLLALTLCGCTAQSGAGKSASDANKTRGTDATTRESAGANLPVLGRIPRFTAIDATGRPFDSRELDGFAWVGCLVFGAPDAPPPIDQLALCAERHGQLPERRDVRLVALRTPPGSTSPPSPPLAPPVPWESLQVTAELAEKWKTGIASSTELPSRGVTFFLTDAAGRVRGCDYPATKSGVDALFADLAKLFAERKSVPPEAVDPPWLESRAEAQLAAIADSPVFHDFRFVDRRIESGILFRNKVTDDASKYYEAGHYDHGNGVAVADVDLDGREDLYFVNQVGGCELWRNLGDGKFADMTVDAGVGLADRIGVAASFADIDNDGDPDLYVTTTRGGNVLFENDGHGRFADISRASGTDYVGHSSASVFFDFNRDGRLDLLLCNVGRFTTDEQKLVTMEPLRAEPDAKFSYYDSVKDAFAGHLKPERTEPSVLYENTGNNVFRDVTAEMGLVDESWCGDASVSDVNGDGWPDVYLVNMQGHDQYYENVEGRKFVRKSRELFPKTPWGSMGVKWFDYDNDGDFDLLVTDMHSDMSTHIGPEKEKLKSEMKFPESFLKSNGQSLFGNALYRYEPPGKFTEVSDELGVENYWPWGVSVGDLNADGFADVFIASSMNLPFRYGVNSVLLNDRGRKFVDSEFALGVEPRRGNRTAAPWYEVDCDGADAGHLDCEGRSGKVVVFAALGSRSSVLFDLDHDGDLDIVTNDFNTEPLVLISDLTERQADLRYLKVRLQGTVSNRQGLGAIVRVRAGDHTWTQAYDGKSGYLSQSDMPLYFGLGESSAIEAVEVTWPTSKQQSVSGPFTLNTTLTIQETP